MAAETHDTAATNLPPDSYSTSQCNVHASVLHAAYDLASHHPPVDMLLALKHIYAVQAMRQFLHEVAVFLRNDARIPRQFALCDALRTPDALTQQAALEFLHRNGLWCAYLVYRRYDSVAASGLSRPVRAAIRIYAGCDEVDDLCCAQLDN